MVNFLKILLSLKTATHTNTLWNMMELLYEFTKISCGMYQSGFFREAEPLGNMEERDLLQGNE